MSFADERQFYAKRRQAMESNMNSDQVRFLNMLVDRGIATNDELARHWSNDASPRQSEWERVWLDDLIPEEIGRRRRDGIITYKVYFEELVRLWENIFQKVFPRTSIERD
jgi:hypothetical protein